MHNLILYQFRRMKLHDKIKLLRLSKNLTQLYLAEELGIDVANYSRLERGVTSISINRLEEIASILEIDVADFLSKNAEIEMNGHFEKLITELEEIKNELKKINNKLNQNQ